ncbi:methanogen output domain 1-containing protein [Fictibacillus sp. KU28468]|uniref:methanogen output domain 1-containing protein n=1 Tax=Fictibacillus sp. KU28468 TaxID=2991053 RepID=UPI00223D79D7|nr:methanogen output domain 1-containing protein [Fictibacillus sp. KU28468]UZJ77604.1 methanogen output domain 1-containing protein [Fictibacillus sp. KU28468]
MEDQGLNRHFFLAKLITQYAYLHRKTVGPAAEEYIRQIGIRTGEWIESFYNENSAPWSIDQYANVIIDIKNRIGGHFEIVKVEKNCVVVKANSCPFGSVVRDAPHLCMMTSSVFGGIAARKFGYGKVSLRKRIALGESNCEVAIYFSPNETEDGLVFEDLPVTPVNADPFLWEEETIKMLNEELRRSDDMLVKLLDELEVLKQQVKESGSEQKA